jgi:hypothetical protein
MHPAAGGATGGGRHRGADERVHRAAPAQPRRVTTAVRPRVDEGRRPASPMSRSRRRRVACSHLRGGRSRPRPRRPPSAARPHLGHPLRRLGGRSRRPRTVQPSGDGGRGRPTRPGVPVRPSPSRPRPAAASAAASPRCVVSRLAALGVGQRHGPFGATRQRRVSSATGARCRSAAGPGRSRRSVAARRAIGRRQSPPSAPGSRCHARHRCARRLGGLHRAHALAAFTPFATFRDLAATAFAAGRRVHCHRGAASPPSRPSRFSRGRPRCTAVAGGLPPGAPLGPARRGVRHRRTACAPTRRSRCRRLAPAAVPVRGACCHGGGTGRPPPAPVPAAPAGRQHALDHRLLLGLAFSRRVMPTSSSGSSIIV